MAYKKVINGQVYYQNSGEPDKVTARKTAKRLREKGYLVRILPAGKFMRVQGVKWDVYATSRMAKKGKQL